MNAPLSFMLGLIVTVMLMSGVEFSSVNGESKNSTIVLNSQVDSIDLPTQSGLSIQSYFNELKSGAVRVQNHLLHGVLLGLTELKKGVNMLLNYLIAQFVKLS